MEVEKMGERFVGVEIRDVDEAGNVLNTYFNDGDGFVQSPPKQTPTSLAKALLAAFLPAGYPHSVTPDYLGYQLYDSLQAFSSSMASLLASRAVLEGLGVGDDQASPTAALFLTIAQETAGRLATILFAHRFGTAIEPECKRYRFLADVFNDAALLLDVAVPTLSATVGRPGLAKVLVLAAASILRSLCGVAAGASKATLSAHFALTGNLAELNAKEASQETVVSLLGLLAGTVLVRLVHSRPAVWAWMLALTALHLWTNYRGVRAVRLRCLNRQRATLVFGAYLVGGVLLDPYRAAQQESVVWGADGELTRPVLPEKDKVLLLGPGNAVPPAVPGIRAAFAVPTSPVAVRRDLVGQAEFVTSFARLLELDRPESARRIVGFTETDRYLLAVSRGSGRGGAHKDLYRIMLKQGATPRDGLEAWMRAMTMAYTADATGPGPVLGTVDKSFWDRLEMAGWNLDLGVLETKRQYRLDAGGGAESPKAHKKQM